MRCTIWLPLQLTAVKSLLNRSDRDTIVACSRGTRRAKVVADNGFSQTSHPTFVAIAEHTLWAGQPAQSKITREQQPFRVATSQWAEMRPNEAIRTAASLQAPSGACCWERL